MSLREGKERQNEKLMVLDCGNSDHTGNRGRHFTTGKGLSANFEAAHLGISPFPLAFHANFLQDLTNKT